MTQRAGYQLFFLLGILLPVSRLNGILFIYFLCPHLIAFISLYSLPHAVTVVLRNHRLLINVPTIHQDHCISDMC